ncbi:MAG: type II toxin-antitoxin system RelE/ParE family toxin [Candidatus Schekmanbacteria bacterium]|nr:type II toxin-antitoxin system RelE/ParE family toxin [Candidatus Schekmanbacteria bacterium]
MKFIFTEKALKDYKSLPVKLQSVVDKQLKALLRDIRYPSLKARKYNEADDIWQARVNRDYRFYFLINDDTYIILTVIKHPK